MLLIHPIQIQEYLYKYLQYYHPTDPYFKLTEKNKVGSYLIGCLQPKSAGWKDNYQLNLKHPIKLNIAIPEHYGRNYGIVISEMNQSRFNDFLKDDLQERFIDYCWDSVNIHNQTIYKSILLFREKYSISEDDLATKTMQKWWDRGKNRLSNCKSA